MFSRYRGSLNENLDKFYGCPEGGGMHLKCADGSLGFAPAGYITLVCVGIFLLVPPAMAALEVLLFHIYLIRHRITTYEYVYLFACRSSCVPSIYFAPLLLPS